MSEPYCADVRARRLVSAPTKTVARVYLHVFMSLSLSLLLFSPLLVSFAVKLIYNPASVVDCRQDPHRNRLTSSQQLDNAVVIVI